MAEAVTSLFFMTIECAQLHTFFDAFVKYIFKKGYKLKKGQRES